MASFCTLYSKCIYCIASLCIFCCMLACNTFLITACVLQYKDGRQCHCHRQFCFRKQRTTLTTRYSLQGHNNHLQCYPSISTLSADHLRCLVFIINAHHRNIPFFLQSMLMPLGRCTGDRLVAHSGYISHYLHVIVSGHYSRRQQSWE